MATTRATKETLYLRRDFTADERLEMGRDLAQGHNRLAAIDDEEKSMKATVKEKRTGVELTIGSLSRKLNDGYEMANVSCTLHWDALNVGEVTYRDPLGNVVRTRAMNIDERQDELPFEESAANINAFLGGLDTTPDAEKVPDEPVAIDPPAPEVVVLPAGTVTVTEPPDDDFIPEEYIDEKGNMVTLQVPKPKSGPKEPQKFHEQQQAKESKPQRKPKGFDKPTNETAW